MENGKVFILQELNPKVDTRTIELPEAENSKQMYMGGAVLFFLKDNEIFAHGVNSFALLFQNLHYLFQYSFFSYRLGEIGVRGTREFQKWAHVQIFDEEITSKQLKIAKCCTFYSGSNIFLKKMKF